jgi:predicted RecA/RadA family phage recombinase
MAETGLKLRCDGARQESFIVTAISPGVTAGQADLVHDTVGVYAQTAATGEEVAFIYRACKILVPKRVGSTNGILEAGDKVYFDHAAADFSNDSSGNVLCGICLKAAGAADTTMLIDLFGFVGI